MGDVSSFTQGWPAEMDYLNNSEQVSSSMNYVKDSSLQGSQTKARKLPEKVLNDTYKHTELLFISVFVTRDFDL